MYTLSLALALWRRRNRRGAVGAFILAVMVLVLPPLVQYYLTVR